MKEISERLLENASKALGLCGNGKDMNWSVRIADYFFVDCACCIFWRGILLGVCSGIWLTVVLYYIYRSI